MESKIKELIEKYGVKTTEEPLNYCQWVEVVEDLQSLLKFYQTYLGKIFEEIVNENAKDKTIGK